MRWLPVLLIVVLITAGCLGSPETPQDGDDTAGMEEGFDGSPDAGDGAPEGTPRLSVAIGDVGYDYSDERGEGTLRGVVVEVTNDGDVVVAPRLRVTVERDGEEIYREEDTVPRFGTVDPGESAGERVHVQRRLPGPGRYEVTVAVTTEDGRRFLATASRGFTVA